MLSESLALARPWTAARASPRASPALRREDRDGTGSNSTSVDFEPSRVAATASQVDAIGTRLEALELNDNLVLPISSTSLGASTCSSSGGR